MKHATANSPATTQTLRRCLRLELSLGLLATLAVLQTGCSAPRSLRTENLNSPPALAALGTIGVIATSTVPKFIMHQPLNRSEAGELTARRIAFVGGDDFTDNASAVISQMTLGLSTAALLAVAIPSRAAVEAMTISEQGHTRANLSLEKTIVPLSLQDELRARVAERAAARASRPVKLVRKPFPPGREAEFSRMSCVMAGTLAWLPRGQTAADYLAGQGVDTVLELQLIHPGLKGSGKINPPLALCVDVRARLLEAGSGQELWHGTGQYRSAKHTFTQWAAKDAQLFRRELDRCFASLSDQIVDQLLKAPAGDTGPSLAGLAQQ